MPRLRRLKAREVLRALRGFGFDVVSMRGSHAKLVRIAPSGKREILIVPVHRELTAGTLQAIYRQAGRFVHEQDLRREFFSD